MSDFGRELFEYMTSLVPFWRVSDDAWNLGGDAFLAGIEVLRNYGGEVMVIPWDEERREELIGLRHLATRIDLQRVVVVVDDRTAAAWQEIEKDLAPIVVLPWSRRIDLTATLVKDIP